MSNLTINIVDLLILGILGVTAIFAFFRGFVREVLGVGSWIGAAIITIALLPKVRPWLESQIGSPTASILLGGLVIFVASLLFLWTLTHILSTRIQSSSVGALDRTLGLLAGAVKGVFYVSILYIVVSWLVPAWSDRAWARESRLLPIVDVTAGWIEETIGRHRDAGVDEIKKAVGEDGAGYTDHLRRGLNKLIEESAEPE